MRIDAIRSVSQVYKSNTAYKSRTESKAYSSDKLELSQAGKDFQVAKAAVAEAPDVREDLVADIKARMANGTYQVSSEAFANKLVDSYSSNLVF